MMRTERAATGIGCLGELAWGSHFCHFYRTEADLVDSLVPYFRAGLEAGERCLWVTSEPLRASDARRALAAAMPDLAAREERGEIAILDHGEWYLQTGHQDADAVLRGWVDAHDRALAAGFTGLRVSGNTAWLERSGWRDFMEYEARVSGTFEGRRMIALCSYDLGRCDADAVLDVVRNHELAIARRGGTWEVVEATAMKVAKAELARANAVLEERVAERTERLRAALAHRDDFLSVASHELRTPITALQLQLQTMLRALDRATDPSQAVGEVRERIGRTLRQGDRLAALVGDLLDVTRARDGALPVQPAPADLAAIAREAVTRLAEPLARAGCAVSLDAPSPVPGRWDALRLDQVLTNLLMNAARHAPGEVRVTVVEDDGRARLDVRDRGAGVPPADRERIFGAFERGPNARAGGFGLGLWIVRRIVDAHGGAVRVEDAPGGGARFVVELPFEAPAGSA
jgi:signal transduction histidine kinase